MSKTKTGVVCTVCAQPKNELTPSRSQIMPNINLFRCGECVAGKKEPRWVIMMAAKSFGGNAVRPWVINRRYVGEEIKLSDVL